jgi:hypothetical protein
VPVRQRPEVQEVLPRQERSRALTPSRIDTRIPAYDAARMGCRKKSGGCFIFFLTRGWLLRILRIGQTGRTLEARTGDEALRW